MGYNFKNVSLSVNGRKIEGFDHGEVDLKRPWYLIRDNCGGLSTVWMRDKDGTEINMTIKIDSDTYKAIKACDQYGESKLVIHNALIIDLDGFRFNYSTD